MSRFTLVAYLFVLVPLGNAVAQAPGKADDGDKTTPLLLDLVRARLAAAPGTAPADGVQVNSVRFFRGVLTLNGAVKNANQRDKILEVLNGARVAIEDEADVKIKQIDIAHLTVPPAAPERLQAMPRDLKSPEATPQPSAPAPQSAPEWTVAPEENDAVFVAEPFVSSAVEYPATPRRAWLFWRSHYRTEDLDEVPGLPEWGNNAFSMQPSRRCWWCRH